MRRRASASSSAIAVFADYEDDGVFYEKRPTVWVEPVGDWGEGAVQLVEIPTDAEIHDNIVAYWVPKEPVKAGDERDFRYRVYWIKDEPFPSQAGRVVASRRGRGDRPAEVDKLGLVKYAIDFEGGELAKYESGDAISRWSRCRAARCSTHTPCASTPPTNGD